MIGLFWVIGFKPSILTLIAGFLELIGACILALPDLELYRDWFYAGNLKDAKHTFDWHLNDGQSIGDDVDWYNAFYEFVEENRVIPPSDLPERRDDSSKEPRFRHESSGNSKHFVTKSYGGEIGRISYQNFKSRLENEIENYDAKIRRDGITLLSLGFIFQIFGAILTLA